MGRYNRYQHRHSKRDYIKDEVSQYRITIKEREDSTEVITSKDIDLNPVFDDSFDKIISSQETKAKTARTGSRKYAIFFICAVI